MNQIENLRQLPAFIAAHEEAHRIDQRMGFGPVADDVTSEWSAQRLQSMCGMCTGAVLGIALGSRSYSLRVVEPELPETVALGYQGKELVMASAKELGLPTVSLVDYEIGIKDLFLQLWDASIKFKRHMAAGWEYRDRIRDEAGCDSMSQFVRRLRDLADYDGCIVDTATDWVSESDLVATAVTVMTIFLEKRCGAPTECFSGRDWPEYKSQTAVFQTLVDDWLPEDYGRDDSYAKELIDGLLEAGKAEPAPVKEPEPA